jgi:hypothetical protein
MLVSFETTCAGFVYFKIQKFNIYYSFFETVPKYYNKMKRECSIHETNQNVSFSSLFLLL